MGTVIVSLILLGIVGLILYSMHRDKKKGINPICGGDCRNCHGACHMGDKPKK